MKFLCLTNLGLITIEQGLLLRSMGPSLFSLAKCLKTNIQFSFLKLLNRTILILKKCDVSSLFNNPEIYLAELQVF